MKKGLIIGGGIVLALMLAAFIIFPGIPTYISAAKEYEHINEPMAEFEKVSEGTDFKEFCVDGIKIKAPKNLEKDEFSGALASPDGEAELVINRTDMKNMEQVLSSIEDYDPWKEYEHSEDEYRHFFDSIGTEIPENCLSTVMIYYIRDEVTAKDCLKLHDTDKDVFKEIAELKDDAFEAEAMWKMNGSGFTAYIGQVFLGGKDSGASSRTWTATIFPDDNKNEYYNILISCENETLVRQMLSSIELDR